MDAAMTCCIVCESFEDNGPEYSGTILDSVEFALTESSRAFVAGHFHYSQSRLGYPDIDKGLHFEAVTPAGCPRLPRRQLKYRQAVAPESVEAIAQITVAGAISDVNQTIKGTVSGPTDARNVVAAASDNESCAFCEVRAL